MSVLIHGMEMPKGNATKTITICSDGTVFCEDGEDPKDVYKACMAANERLSNYEPPKPVDDSCLANNAKAQFLHYRMINRP